MKNKFFKFKQVWCVLSVLLAICSIASLLLFRIKWGTEFIGGTIITWKFFADVQTVEILNLYSEKGINVENIIKTGENSYLVYTEKLEDNKVQELTEYARQKYPNTERTGVETVGEMGEKDIVTRIIISFGLILISTIMFFFYSFGNLRKRYSPILFSFCVLLAVIFDLVVIAGIVAILGKYFEVVFSTPFLVCSFVVIIFSIFSKYFVFNKIRDNLLEFKKEDISTVLNRVMSENLPTIVKVLLIVIISLLPIIFFGGRDFQNPAVFLLAVISISTYSGLFVTHQLILLFSKKAVPTSAKSASKRRKKSGRKKR